MFTERYRIEYKTRTKFPLPNISSVRTFWGLTSARCRFFLNVFLHQISRNLIANLKTELLQSLNVWHSTAAPDAAVNRNPSRDSHPGHLSIIVEHVPATASVAETPKRNSLATPERRALIAELLCTSNNGVLTKDAFTSIVGIPRFRCSGNPDMVYGCPLFTLGYFRYPPPPPPSPP